MLAPGADSRQRASIEVVRLQPVAGHGALRAFATIRIGCIEIADCRVIQEQGKAAWVSLPQTPIRAKADGSGAGWRAIIKITNPEVLARVRAAVLTAWQASSPSTGPRDPGQRDTGDPARPFDDRLDDI